jgi:NADP-dependent alcohol dehydrogenase
MQNFNYLNPTGIIFGRGMIAEIGNRVPMDQTVLFLYGGGSIQRNGVYSQVTSALKHHRVVEFGGVEPNPLYETCLQALDVVRSEKVGFILAVGGGSVIDAGKFIAAAACFEGKDPWEILTAYGANVKRALPIGTVLTLPATGTEANGNSVISRKSTSEKLHFTSAAVFPAFSVLDPETTFSLPRKQVRNGIADAFVHVMEQYMTYPTAAALQDRLAESILQTLVEVAPVTLAEPQNYDARATFMWSATLALNTLISCGVPQDWGTHMIGHELTAFYGLDHAETLVIVLPGLWQHQLSQKRLKLEQYGRRVWGVTTAEAAIEKTEAFFQSLGFPTRLNAYQIVAGEAAEKVRTRFAQRKAAYGERGDIDAQAAAAILALRA